MTALGQRGTAVVAALGVLSAMTLLATMSLMAGGADLVIATRQSRQRSAFYAADSALETTLAELIDGGGVVPAASFQTPWPAPGIGVRSWHDGAWECSRRICLIPDAGDADGDPATTVVLFNNGFGHRASPLARGGYPLVQVLVTAREGESRQAIVAEVAPVTCAPQLDAAWTSAGELVLSGDLRISGTAGLAAVAGRSPARLFDGAAVEGEQIVEPQLPLPTDALTVLNAGGSLPGLDDLPAAPAEGPLDGVYWSRGDYGGSLDGQGMLVVHNPGFDPVKHEASRLAIEEGRLVEGRDPDYSHLDPTRQPARLEITRGGSFSGVIVADTVGSASAGFTLTGALVTLVRSPLTTAASSPLRIVASREAIERAGRGPLRLVTAFRPVTVGDEELGACP